MRRAGRACPAFWTTQRADDLAAIAERLRLATEDTNAPATNRQPERTENVEVSFYQEPQVGIEPTTARLRIECSTTELLWRDPARAMHRRVTRMPWLGFEPRRLSAPPPQDGVSTSSTTPAWARLSASTSLAKGAGLSSARADRAQAWGEVLANGRRGGIKGEYALRGLCTRERGVVALPLLFVWQKARGG